MAVVLGCHVARRGMPLLLSNTRPPAPTQLLSDPKFMGCGHVKFMGLEPAVYGITK
jgi:hypothetical protein